MPVPVVIYARYSSDNQREESIEGQIRVCKDFAAKNDMEVIAVYADRAMSPGLSADAERREEARLSARARLER